MRYFKYKNLLKTENSALKAQYAELKKEEKRLLRKNKLLNNIGIVVFSIVSVGCVIPCFIALKSIPVSDNEVVAFLEYLGVTVAGMLAVIASLLAGGVVSSFVFRKAYDERLVISKNALSKACAHLREYYGVAESCIVTKCYESSDEKFNAHDVCVFVVNDELRITTDLKNGFLHGDKDLGCYAFNTDEIVITKIQGKNFLIAELKCGEVVFRLGYRAKSFIEKNFINAKSGS